jgi:predicted secreted protein
MLRTGLLAAALAVFSFTALAGDQADREIIGFSPDGGTFAFEEYGVEDGSGFPYSNIYVIETDTDEWVAGTPVRVRIEDDDNATLEDARALAREQAQALLDERQIEPGYNLLASNPLTEITANPHEVRFVTHPHMAATNPGWSVQIAEKELPAADCPDGLGGPFQGFTLTLTDPDGNTRTLHDDTRIPSSRKCPLNYAVSDVISVYPDGAEPVLVILVNMFSLGFEGPNRRFLAVTTRFEG